MIRKISVFWLRHVHPRLGSVALDITFLWQQFELSVSGARLPSHPQTLSKSIVNS